MALHYLKLFRLSEEQFKLDPDLKFSDENFKSILLLNLTQKQNDLIKFSIRREYPKPYIFAKFASKSYEEDQTTDLLNDWQLLTTASNTKILNSYFGAAYWHKSKQQIVIAHRSI